MYHNNNKYFKCLIICINLRIISFTTICYFKYLLDKILLELIIVKPVTVNMFEF